MDDFGQKYVWLYIIVQQTGRYFSVPVAKTMVFEIFTFKNFSIMYLWLSTVLVWSSMLLKPKMLFYFRKSNTPIDDIQSQLSLTKIMCNAV